MARIGEDRQGKAGAEGHGSAGSGGDWQARIGEEGRGLARAGLDWQAHIAMTEGKSWINTENR